jgi:hypothetical protein
MKHRTPPFRESIADARSSKGVESGIGCITQIVSMKWDTMYRIPALLLQYFYIDPLPCGLVLNSGDLSVMKGKGI